MGKTTWGLNMMKDHPEKKYNVIGTDTLIDKMKVMGLPRRRNYRGRWDKLIEKSTKCLNKIFEIGKKQDVDIFHRLSCVDYDGNHLLLHQLTDVLVF